MLCGKSRLSSAKTKKTAIKAVLCTILNDCVLEHFKLAFKKKIASLIVPGTQQRALSTQYPYNSSFEIISELIFNCFFTERDIQEYTVQVCFVFDPSPEKPSREKSQAVSQLIS